MSPLSNLSLSSFASIVSRAPSRFVVQLLASLLILAPVSAWERASGEPVEIDALFANPGMGWQTFHTFADKDPSLQGLPSSSAYFRFYWRELEPAEGAIDYGKIEGLLASAKQAGQKLCFRVMCTGSGEYMDVPAWLKEKGCKGFEFDYGGARHWVPDFEDLNFQQAHYRFIRQLGVRIGLHPNLDLVDVGSVGLWGEWHMSDTRLVDTNAPVPLPSPKTRTAIIESWRWAFPTKPKVMLIGDIDGLRHATRNGCGWRADCLGDMGGFSKNWNHMRDLYPAHLQKAQAQEAWKRGPVAFESCWDMRKWKQEGWDIRYIFDYALSNHVSYMNNKSSPIPDEARPEVERFLRRIGYRLVLRKWEHDRKTRPGEAVVLSMTWENAGVAPPYGTQMLAFRLIREDNTNAGSPALLGQNTIRSWMPGSKKLVELLTVPQTQLPGEYRLLLGVVDPVTRTPAVQLAIDGRRADGWYPLGQIEVLTHEPGH